MIFAAGLGTRLKPLTDTMPKALVPLAGKSLLQWQVEKLRDAGISDIVVNVHHFPDQIIEAVRANQGWGCSIAISDERDALLDTGGGLRKAQEILIKKKKLKDEPILACNVDILSNIDLRALVQSYDPSSMGSLVVSERETQRYLCFDGEERLCGWTNVKTGELKGKDGRHLAFSGMQILNPAIFDRMDDVVARKGDKFSLIDLYLSVCDTECFRAYIPTDYRMMDVGKIDQIDEAEVFAEKL